MINSLTYNQMLELSDLFINDKDFVQELIEDANKEYNYDKIGKIMKAKEEFENRKPLSDEVVAYINDNADYLLKKMEEKKKATKDEKENVEESSNDIDNKEAEDKKEEEKESNQEKEAESKDETVEKENNVPKKDVELNETKQQEVSMNVEYSSAIAKSNLRRKLSDVNAEIQQLEQKMNYSEKVPSKSDYNRWFQLKAYRDNLEGHLNALNMEESYGQNNKIGRNDQNLNKLDDKIDKLNQRLKGKTPRFIKVVIAKRIKKLQQKRGKIALQQRKLVNKELLKYYKSSLKQSSKQTKRDSVDKYYRDKAAFYKEKRDSVLDNVDYNHNNKIVTNLKNMYYTLKSVPSSLCMEYFDRLSKKQGFKNDEGRMIDSTIASVVYDNQKLAVNGSYQTSSDIYTTSENALDEEETVIYHR